MIQFNLPTNIDTSFNNTLASIVVKLSDEELANVMQPPTTMAGEHYYQVFNLDRIQHEQRQRQQLHYVEQREMKFSTSTASPGEFSNITACDTTTTTTAHESSNSFGSSQPPPPLATTKVALENFGRGIKDIKLRNARSAPEDPSAKNVASIQTVPMTMTMTSIQSVVGQPLIIPCTNQTFVAAAAAPVADQTLSGYVAQHPPPPLPGARGHRLYGGGGGAGQLRSTAGQRGGKPAVANGQGISLIVWHKDDRLDSPIFTVDARGATSLREAKQQTGLESLKGRAHLEESTRLDSRGFGSTPALVIDEANGNDGGVYTCTIEFYEAQTQTYQMRVLLISK